MDSNWQSIESAPKDGTWFLAHGTAYAELADRGMWFTHDCNDSRRKPYTMIIHWVEGWYDKEIDNGDGTYRKERTQGYAYWGPEPHAFRPSHWMPLPDGPDVVAHST